MKTTLEEPKGEKSPRLPKHSPRVIRFCELVVSGHTHAGAYRIAYKKPKIDPQDAAERGWRVTQQPGVKDRISHLREKSGAKTLLTLNDRLGILARDAQTGGDSASEKNARARAIEVYSKISGDNAPEAHVHTHTGPDGGPIPVAATVVVGRASVRSKLEALRARRKGEGA